MCMFRGCTFSIFREGNMGVLTLIVETNFFKFLKLRLELRVSSRTCLCLTDSKNYSLAGHLVRQNRMSIVFDFSVCIYLRVYVCKVWVEEKTRAVFRGCKSDFFLDFVIHTYFHHWIEMWGWQQTHAIWSLQCYILLQVWENVRLRDRCIPKIYVVLNIRSKS